MKSERLKKLAKLVIPAVAFAIISLSAKAQDQGLPCDGTDIDTECPIDGGVILLMAAGAFAGYKKFNAK